jgi:GNAT superfamily N-acetyltransferase
MTAMPARRPIVVSQANAQDAEAVIALDREARPGADRAEMIRQAIAAGHCHIARLDDCIAGYAILTQSFFGHGFIELLMVHPGYRRYGVATALIHRCEAICPTEKLFTSTNQSNLPMQWFCASLGFVRSGIIENLDEGDPEIVFLKRIRDLAQITPDASFPDQLPYPRGGRE